MYILAHLEAIGEQSINFAKISIMSQEEIEDLHIEENNELNSEELYERLTLVVDKGQEPLRIDKFLLHKVVNTSRNKIQNAIDKQSHNIACITSHGNVIPDVCV
jgi:RNA-binding protein YlmH